MSVCEHLLSVATNLTGFSIAHPRNRSEASSRSTPCRLRAALRDGGFPVLSASSIRSGRDSPCRRPRCRQPRCTPHPCSILASRRETRSTPRSRRLPSIVRTSSQARWHRRGGAIRGRCGRETEPQSAPPVRKSSSSTTAERGADLTSSCSPEPVLIAACVWPNLLWQATVHASIACARSRDRARLARPAVSFERTANRSLPCGGAAEAR